MSTRLKSYFSNGKHCLVNLTSCCVPTVVKVEGDITKEEENHIRRHFGISDVETLLTFGARKGDLFHRNTWQFPFFAFTDKACYEAVHGCVVKWENADISINLGNIFIQDTKEDGNYILLGVADTGNITTITNFLTGFCSLVSTSEIDEDTDCFNQLVSIGRVQEAIVIGKKWLSRNNAFFFHRMAELYYDNREYEQLINLYSTRRKVIITDDEENTAILALYYYAALAFEEKGNVREARQIFHYVYTNAKPNDIVGNSIFIKEDSLKRFHVEEERFLSTFVELPYVDRKLLVPVNEYKELGQVHLNIIKANSVPNIYFKPLGTPLPNSLYIGHPYCSNVYIPFESYQLDLLEDKIREFCHIAQCLGAKKITVETFNGSNTESSRSINKGIGGSGTYSEYGLGLSSQKKRDQRILEELGKKLSIYQEHTPTSPPYLPKDLVWYPHEPSWQRFYSQRMAGQVIHEERIESNRNVVVEGQELLDIKGEFKAIVISMNGEWTNSIEESFKQTENATLSIKVEFAPLSQLIGNQRQDSSIQNASEKDYLDELKATLEDGEIGPRERKSLERARVRLGISEARAAEIEASVSAPTLTDEEKAYLAEVKAVLEDGEIGPRERKSLERTRNRLGISEERAKELERL